jgi:hypothetical protein
MPDLRPGNRGIGVSVAVGTLTTGFGSVSRTVIKTLQACNSHNGNHVSIQPGTGLLECRIRRDCIPGEVYVMEFETTGQRYYCPLAQFLPRTAVRPAGVEEKPARDSVAV